ncbi:MAG: FecR family protein [Myxococcota bacterium]|nr:FecR family protein [Myxococcota bacterium]
MAATAGASTVLTATHGNVSVNGETATQSDAVGTGDTVEVEGGAIASVLVGDTALVRMCHGAALGFGNDSGDGPSALNLRGGQVKVSAGKRPAGDPLEIHTPAAIATLMGTEVHLSVDRDSGATTITSLEHQIRIAGSSKQPQAPIVISPGEKITVSKDGVVGEVETASAPDLAFSSDCLDDARFRIAAVKAAVRQYADKSVEQIAKMDTEVDVPMVASGPPIIPTGTLGAPLTIPPCISGVVCAGGAAMTNFPVEPKIPDTIPSGPSGP